MKLIVFLRNYRGSYKILETSKESLINPKRNFDKSIKLLGELKYINLMSFTGFQHFFFKVPHNSCLRNMLLLVRYNLLL